MIAWLTRRQDRTAHQHLRERLIRELATAQDALSAAVDAQDLTAVASAAIAIDVAFTRWERSSHLLEH